MEGARWNGVVSEQRPEGTSGLHVFYPYLLPVKKKQKLPHVYIDIVSMHYCHILTKHHFFLYT